MRSSGDSSEHLQLLKALARRGAEARVVAELSGARVIVGLDETAAAASGDQAPTERTGFPLAFLAMARAAGHVAEAAVGGCFRITPEGRALVRRHRATTSAIRAASGSDHILPFPTERAIFNEAESPLAWLRRRHDREGRPLLGAEQFEAGERLRADLDVAQLTPRVTQSWSGLAQTRRERRGSPPGSASISDRAIAARQRVGRALEAVGPELANILIDVCGHLRGLEEIEQREAWPQRSAKLILQKALSALARHYGLLPGQDLVAVAEQRLRHWGADGYRPELAPRGEGS